MVEINFGALRAAAPVAATGESKGGMSTILQFLLVLGIIIFAAKAGGYLSTRLGQPAVLGELLAGVVLGVIFLMFMAGLETNLKEMSKVGKVAVFSGVSGVIVPIGLGFLVALPFGYAGEKALFIGIILAATSVSISAQTLMELGVLRKKEGIAMLGAAVLDDVLVVLVLSFFLALVVGGGSGGVLDLLIVVGRMIAFFVVTTFLGLKLLPWLLSKVKKLPISESLTATTVVLVVLTAWAAEFLGGVAMIVGAFLIGVLIGQTHARHELEEKFHVIIYSIFVPIFFVSIGLILNLKEVEGSTWLFAGVICLTAIISKIIGCGLGARLAGFSNLSSFRLGLGMVSRGEVGLIVASVGIAQGIINSQVYAGIVVMVLVTTLFTPLALKLAFRNEKQGPPGRIAENAISQKKASEMAAATASEQNS